MLATMPSKPDSSGTACTGLLRRRELSRAEITQQNMGMGGQTLRNAGRRLPNIQPIPTDTLIPTSRAAMTRTSANFFPWRGSFGPCRAVCDVVLDGVGPRGPTNRYFPIILPSKRRSWVVGVPQAHVEPFVPAGVLDRAALNSAANACSRSGFGKARDLTACLWRDPAQPTARNQRASRSEIVDNAACRSIFVDDETGGTP